MAVPLLIVSTIASAVGALSQAGAASRHAQAQKQAAEFNAAIARQNAALAQQQAAVDAETKRREQRQKLGAVIAAGGASGVGQVGSVSDILADTAASTELDILLTQHRGDLAAAGFQNTAQLNESAASAARDRASAAMRAGFISAAGKLGRGGVDIFDALKQE